MRRAREISAEIERRVEEVTSDPPEGGEAEAQQAGGAPETAPDTAKDTDAGEAGRGPSAANLEALSTIASENAGGGLPEIPPAPPDAPTTVVPEAAIAVAADAKDAIRTDEKALKEAPGPTPAPGGATPKGPDTPDENEA